MIPAGLRGVSLKSEKSRESLYIASRAFFKSGKAKTTNSTHTKVFITNALSQPEKCVFCKKLDSAILDAADVLPLDDSGGTLANSVGSARENSCRTVFVTSITETRENAGTDVP